MALRVQGKVVKQKSRFATEAGAAEDTADDSPTGSPLSYHCTFE